MVLAGSQLSATCRGQSCPPNGGLQGIMLAIARQVLPALPEPPKVMRIDVKGRSALEVRNGWGRPVFHGHR
jgi:hypothetical protein